MARYTEEFKNTIIELYKSGKSLSALHSEYGIPKSTIATWGDTEIRVKTGHIFCKHIDMTGLFTYFSDSYSLTLL